MSVLYRNLSGNIQTINLNTNRSVYVQHKEAVELQDGEEKSDEIVCKLTGQIPKGRLEQIPAVVQKREDKKEDKKSHSSGTAGNQE